MKGRSEMTQKMSRRAFLKGTLTAAGSAVAASPLAASARAAQPPEDPLVTVIDISRCTGCEACVYACREINTPKFPRPEKPFPAMFPGRVPVEDWSGRQDVSDRLTPYNWLYIQQATAVVDNQEIELTIPRRCMHCNNPPCVKLCPWGAAKQEPSGLSRIDADICLGGSKCNKVCPWDIPQRQTGVGLYLDILPRFAGNGVMYKCDRCYQEIENGGSPACIEACPETVQTMGPKSEMVGFAKDLARDTNGYLYGLAENGGTNTIYVSPVPFDRLVMETGRGRPGMTPVKDRMALGSNLAMAMAIAPLAGVAAALGKFYSRVKGE